MGPGSTHLECPPSSVHCPRSQRNYAGSMVLLRVGSTTVVSITSFHRWTRQSLFDCRLAGDGAFHRWCVRAKGAVGTLNYVAQWRHGSMSGDPMVSAGFLVLTGVASVGNLHQDCCRLAGCSVPRPSQSLITSCKPRSTISSFASSIKPLSAPASWSDDHPLESRRR